MVKLNLILKLKSCYYLNLSRRIKLFSFLHIKVLNMFLELLKDTQVDVRRHLEAEGQRHHGEVEGVDAVDLLERVRVVSPHVRLVGFLGRLVQIVVLLDELLQLNNRSRLKSGH